MKIYLDTKHMKHVVRIEEMLADEARCNCNFGNTDYEIIADENESNWIDECGGRRLLE